MAASRLTPLVLINAVGMTSRLLPHAPRMRELARKGWVRPLEEVLPAVTCTAQATLLTGQPPDRHGIVANGWLFRDTGEVRFWQQSNRLIEAEPFYVTARRLAAERGLQFRSAKLFWWFNQGADVDYSVTPKPYYGADGNKAFGITGRPEGLTEKLEQKLGKFPFHTFWGPLAGKGCTEWIARCAAEVMKNRSPDLKMRHPDLTLVYLPHLDYDPQRYGPAKADMPRLVRELDDAVGIILDAAQRMKASTWVVSEYGHCQVEWPIYPNRALRQAGFLTVRDGPFGESLETFESQAFAVCDHQLAHIYLNDLRLMDKVRDVIAGLPGVARVYAGEERRELHLDHPRSGDLVALAEPRGWFAYPFWLNDARAPDHARTVDIHRKPGFDPCEMFFDPRLTFPRLRVLRRLLAKKLGFRILMDVIPLDASIVRGSHGLRATDAADRPILIGDGPPPAEGTLPMTGVRDLVLQALLPE